MREGVGEKDTNVVMLRTLVEAGHDSIETPEVQRPMVQQRLLRSANQLQTAGSVELTSAHWTGDYLKIQIQAAEESHWFTLEPAADDGLKLLGVQE